MSEIDPVIFEFHAKVNGFLADIDRTTSRVDQKVGQQEKRVKSLERTFGQSSSAISTHIRGLAGTLAAAFTGRELMGLLDSFTRLENSLRVAGLEGENFAAVQNRLFGMAQKYGVEVNALGDLYGKAAMAGRELGASQEQLLTLTEATAQALKITGTSTAQASGAILGLSQALAAGTVRAEEFNQINEGGLRPLLQAAAASDRWGGSVAKLRTEVLAGKVASGELAAAILQNAQLLEGQASKATLTLSGGFTALSAAMIKYFGEADRANGVSAALGGALQSLADNLDVIIPALATIAVAIGVRYVAGAVAAAGATTALSTAMFAMQARALGAATSMEALTFAMQGMKGGVATAAVLALSAAFVYLATREQTAADAALRYQTAVASANVVKSKAEDLARKLASATGEERRATELAIAATLKKARADQIAAVAAVKRAQAELAVAQASAATHERSAAANTTGRGSAELGTVRSESQRQLRLKTGNLQGATEALQLLNDTVRVLQNPLSVPALPSLGGGGAGAGSGGKRTKGGGGGASGPSAAEITKRFNDELVALAQQSLSSMAAVTENADERAELELRGVELARIRNIDEIKSNTAYYDAKKKVYTAMGERLRGAVESNAQHERDRIEYERSRAVDAKALQLKMNALDGERATMEAQLRAADTNDERRTIERRILKIQQDEEKARLEAAIAAGDVADATVARTNLSAQQAAQANALADDQAGPLRKWARGMNEKSLQERGEELVVKEIESLREGMNDAITNALGIEDPFIAGLLEMLLDEILFRPLAEMLEKGRSSGGGGILGGLIGGIASIFGFGRASGGSVTGGQLYRVNEGASPGRVEGFMPQGSGTIIPLGMMNQRVAASGSSQPGVVRVEVVGGEMFDVRVTQISGEVSAQVVRTAAPAIIEGASQATMRQANRPRM